MMPMTTSTSLALLKLSLIVCKHYLKIWSESTHFSKLKSQPKRAKVVWTLGHMKVVLRHKKCNRVWIGSEATIGRCQPQAFYHSYSPIWSLSKPSWLTRNCSSPLKQGLHQHNVPNVVLSQASTTVAIFAMCRIRLSVYVLFGCRSQCVAFAVLTRTASNRHFQSSILTWWAADVGVQSDCWAIWCR